MQLKYDVLKTLSENYALEDTNSVAIGEVSKSLRNILEEYVEELASVTKFPAEAVPVFEGKLLDGSPVLLVDAYDLVRYMESSCESDPLVALEKVKSENLIPDNTAKFAVLIKKVSVSKLCEAAETNPTSALEGAGITDQFLRSLVASGIALVSF